MSQLAQMDDLDRQVCHVLQIGPRLSWVDVGEVLDVGPETCASRWRRMRSEGLAWVSVQPQRSPAQSIAIAEICCSPRDRPDLVTALLGDPRVAGVDEASDAGLVLATVQPQDATSRPRDRRRPTPPPGAHPKRRAASSPTRSRNFLPESPCRAEDTARPSGRAGRRPPNSTRSAVTTPWCSSAATATTAGPTPSRSTCSVCRCATASSPRPNGSALPRAHGAARCRPR